jgi:hypothetical protein
MKSKLDEEKEIEELYQDYLATEKLISGEVKLDIKPYVPPNHYDFNTSLNYKIHISELGLVRIVERSGEVKFNSVSDAHAYYKVMTDACIDAELKVIEFELRQYLAPFSNENLLKIRSNTVRH